MYDKGKSLFKIRPTARVYLSANQTCLECTAQVKFPWRSRPTVKVSTNQTYLKCTAKVKFPWRSKPTAKVSTNQTCLECTAKVKFPWRSRPAVSFYLCANQTCWNVRKGKVSVWRPVARFPRIWGRSPVPSFKIEAYCQDLHFCRSDVKVVWYVYKSRLYIANIKKGKCHLRIKVELCAATNSTPDTHPHSSAGEKAALFNSWTDIIPGIVKTAFLHDYHIHKADLNWSSGFAIAIQMSSWTCQASH